jgi:wobble nucleotide-excising tRNase
VNVIKNIRQLKGAAVLAERKAATPSLDFKRFNLVYGFNGSGKSTLSRVFSSLESATKHDRLPEACTFEIEMDDGAKLACPKALAGLEKRVCVFNNDFIADNLKWETGEASPVVYIGSDQAEAVTKLVLLEAALPAATATREGEVKVLKEREKAFTDYKRLLARSVSERLRQAARYEAPQLVSDVERLGAKASDILSDADLDAATATCARSEPPAKVTSVDVPVEKILASILAAAELAPKTIGTVVVDGFITHPEMVPWVKQGHDYHQAHDLASCLYCGEPLSDARKHLLSQAFDDQLTAFIDALSGAATDAVAAGEAVAIATAAVPTAAQLSAEFQPAFEAEAAKLVAALHDVSPLLEMAVTALQARQATPTSVTKIDLPSLEDVAVRVQALEAAAIAVNGVCQQHADMVDDFNTHQQKARDAIRRHFVAEGAKEYGDHVAAIAAAMTSEAKAVSAVDTIEGDIAALRAQIQQHGPAAEKINALVKSYLGHEELKIVAVDRGYELHRHEARVQGAPSEGEKTAIALCYFLSTLEANNRQIKNLIVVIDDPVSSLDTKAMNYACSLIRNRLANVAQLFVLTHNQNCMNEFKKHWKKGARGEAAKQTASLKFIDVSVPAVTGMRTSNIVELPKHLRDFESEYHYLFGKVLAFSAATDAHFDYAFMMPNVLRRVLEIFLAFKVPRDGNISDKLGTLCKRETALDRDRLNALERLTQVESHSDNLDDLIAHSSMTVEESRDANAALIHLIEVVDKAHLEDLRTYC